VPTNLRIFDAQYVADNIYFGDAIGTSQRRNLCNLILGQDGVTLAAEYHNLDTAITEKNGEIREAKRVLTTHVSANLVDQFIELDEDPQIDAKIEAKRKEVEGLKDIDNLRSQALLEKVEFPPLPARLKDILSKTLEDVSRDAEATVKQHLKAHGMEGNASWLSTGMMHHHKDECPWCGQDTKGLSLVEAYQSYFNHTYTTFRRELTQYQGLPGKHYSDDRIELVLNRLQSNTNAAEVWKRYVSFDMPTLPDVDPGALLRAFREQMIVLLDEKAAAPLDALPLSEEYTSAYEAVSQLSEAVTAYNDAVDAANQAINAFKRSASPAKLQSASNELKWHELTKKRHEKTVAEACERYKTLNAGERRTRTKEAGRARQAGHIQR
jgi:wobble nucleotide-excising tRNase